MGDPRSEPLSQRAAQARQRACREKQQRVEAALQQLPQIQAAQSRRSQKTEVRASLTDPDARIMWQAKNGCAPSYNLQISTDAQAGLIVGVGVSQAANDEAELEPAIERIGAHLRMVPQQMVVDEGFINQSSVVALDQRQIDLIGPVPDSSARTQASLKHRGVSPEFFPSAFVYEAASNSYRCPAGKTLAYEGREKKGLTTCYRYRARPADCRACPFKPQCCPQSRKGRSIVRSEEAPAVVAFKVKMQTPEAREIYKQRAGIAEFPNAWIKEKIGLRQFRLRGLAKVTLEALWACLTYNIQQWIRLVWRPQWSMAQTWAA